MSLLSTREPTTDAVPALSSSSLSADVSAAMLACRVTSDDIEQGAPSVSGS